MSWWQYNCFHWKIQWINIERDSLRWLRSFLWLNFLSVGFLFVCFVVVFFCLLKQFLFLEYYIIALQRRKQRFVFHFTSYEPRQANCVFEHSVMTNFNCACPAIQKGQGSGSLSEASSWLTACMSEQRRFWRDCADAQARLNLRCSHRR